MPALLYVTYMGYLILPLNNAEVGIIFLVTIYTNEKWTPESESWAPHSY